MVYVTGSCFLTFECLFGMQCAGEIVALRLNLRSLDDKLRQALNKIIDIKGNSHEDIFIVKLVT